MIFLRMIRILVCINICVCGVLENRIGCISCVQKAFIMWQLRKWNIVVFFSERYHDQSHGQSFFSVLMKQTNKNGLYFLDEPEAALSCQNQLALLYLIEECVKQNCQFIIATHSPILLGFPGAQILSFDEDKVEEVDYKSTSSYQTMKLFLDRYDYFVKDIQENSDGGVL